MSKTKRTIILILALLGAALLAGRHAVYGITFTLTLAGLGCLGLALLTWLTGPFRRPGARRAQRIAWTLIAVLLIAGVVSFVWIESLILGGRGGAPVDDARVLVVLGAGLRGTTPSAILASRLRVTQAYLDAHPDCVAVLTGSQGDDEGMTEARAMADWLERRGIDESRLYLEEKAHNTAQNVKYSLALLEREGLTGPVMVVSSEFHLYRAGRIFGRYGMDVASLPAPTPQIGLVPLNSYLREYCSVVVMGIKDVFGIDE